MEPRKHEESRFHDRLRDIKNDDNAAQTRWKSTLEPLIRNDPLWANMKYYSIERRSREFVLGWLANHGKGKTILDYCCGNGEDAIFAAEAGAKSVVGIDISEISIQNCRALAEKHGLTNVTFEVKDAEQTGFAGDSFDIITEYGALHHLDLERAFSEMVRILKPGGGAICNEALGHNPLIHLYRKMTPHLRTRWEVDHIFKRKQVELAREYFHKVDAYFFHACTLLAVPFRGTGIFEGLLGILERLDDRLLKLPLIRWHAWQVVLVLQSPKK